MKEKEKVYGMIKCKKEGRKHETQAEGKEKVKEIEERERKDEKSKRK